MQGQTSRVGGWGYVFGDEGSGFALGVAASMGIATVINSFTIGTMWPVTISLPAAGIAFLFAAAVGVFFGYYPARRASRLTPIDALRHE